MKKVITFGTFDMFHVGHLLLLERAASFGDSLVVGLSTDELNLEKKKRMPICPYTDRKKILESIRWVDQVFPERSLDDKKEYIMDHGAEVLVMGNDWEGAFDFCKDICDVVYLPRTPAISSTEIIEIIRSRR